MASALPGTYVDAEATVEVTQCLIPDCYTFRLFDEGGNGFTPDFFWVCFAQGDYQAMDNTGSMLFEMMNPDFGSSVEHEFCLPSVFGCTDDAACNYNDDANMDNGTCMIPGEPCSDGDDETILDAIDELCNCVGIPAVYGYESRCVQLRHRVGCQCGRWVLL